MMTEVQDILKTYAQEVSNLYKTGVTTEHSFRGSLQTLLNALLPQYSVVNEPQRSACGAPDYALVGKKDRQPYAYIEAKDLFDNDLRGTNAKGHKEQFDRYKQALSRVAFTDYLDFRFFVDGVETATVSLLKTNAKGGFDIADGEHFVSILMQWADCPIQPISTASRLAEIMAYKAKLLRESIENALGGAVFNRSMGGDVSNIANNRIGSDVSNIANNRIGSDVSNIANNSSVENRTSNDDIRCQYEAFKNVLLHDLTPAGFADLYAQTIAYGMFAARLNDPTTEDFSRQEAATLIPVSNPFLRKIFQSIAGYDLDESIAWIVDDLVSAFAATNVEKIMGRYSQNSLHQDPLIHFYEDFLAAYDPKLRKSCGVYYTPQPVVSFIVRAIDEVLKRDFGLVDGLADYSKIKHKVYEPQLGKKIEKQVHRVQILDPATGTGTFLAEAVRQIYKVFEGNEGMWPQYVEESLRPRLHGFELLMAPYTITHLKLDMLLRRGSGFQPLAGGDVFNVANHCSVENRTSLFYDKHQYTEKRCAHLPHWHQDGKLQFVTFRLADSLPQEKLKQLKTDKELFEKNNPKPWSKETESKYYEQFGTKIDEWLDSGYGSCVLQFPNVRQVVSDALQHFNGDRYIIHSYVVMPNHVHILFEPLGKNKTNAILHTWKRFTATEINKLIGVSGEFWQKESFDRIIRNERHYEYVCQYIKDNPQNLHESKYTLWKERFSQEERFPTAQNNNISVVENRTSQCAVGNRTSRLRVYLTNSLEECHPDTGSLWANWLSNESAEANAIKRDCPVMVMMGNPPYSGESQNKGEWIMNLMEDYKKEPGGKVKLNERNPKWINDDYVKFIRMSQHYIERNEQGVIGFINPHGFLDNPTFRGMRWNLLHNFDKIYTINLHGNSKKKETCPDGSPDENVFDIMQGVSINIFVKTGKKGKNELGKIYYADLYGKREVKNEFLDSHSLYGEHAVEFQELNPKEPMLFFVPKDLGLEEEYNKGISLSDLFIENSMGITTGNDTLLVDFTDDSFKTTINPFEENYIKRYSYRPFDTRYLYYNPDLLARARFAFMQNIKENDIVLLTTKIDATDCFKAFICENIVDKTILSSKDNASVFPLYLYDKVGERHLNIKTELIGDRNPEEFFAYIYAVLHSPTYRERYKEFLKIDFPRIPLPQDETEYQRLVALGQQLIDLHLMGGAVFNRSIGGDVFNIANHCSVENRTSSSSVENRTSPNRTSYPIPGTNLGIVI